MTKATKPEDNMTNTNDRQSLSHVPNYWADDRSYRVASLITGHQSERDAAKLEWLMTRNEAILDIRVEVQFGFDPKKNNESLKKEIREESDNAIPVISNFYISTMLEKAYDAGWRERGYHAEIHRDDEELIVVVDSRRRTAKVRNR